MNFRCWLLGRARATQTKIKAKFKANTLTKENSKIVGLVSFGSLLQRQSIEKKPPGALPRTRGPPEDLLAGSRRPKEAPRLAQEPPRPPPQGRFQSAIWRPTAQELPRSLQNAMLASMGLDFQSSGGRFWRSRPLLLQTTAGHEAPC